MNNNQTKAVAQEFLDGKPDVFVHCSLHMYFPSTMGIEKVGIAPPENTKCKFCWEAYYLVYFASLPPHKRQERLDELEVALNHAAEAERKGEFAFKPYRHPQISISKE